MKQTVIRGLFFVLAGIGLWLVTACRQPTSQGPAVAEVGRRTITLGEIQTRLQQTPAAYQQYVASVEGRRQFVNLLVREKVLLAEAEEMRISREPSFKTAVAKFKEEGQRRLKEYAEALQVESALRRLRTKDLAVTDTEVESYFNSHRSDYEKPLEVTASHILVNTEAEAESALARLKAGEPFEKVARSMSKDPATAARGGKLSPFRRGSLVPEFEEAAFQLKAGQTSGVVKSQFGFHIIRKLGEKSLPARSLGESKEEIRTQLERNKFNQWVTAKQTVLGVKINEQVLSQLSAEEPPKP